MVTIMEKNWEDKESNEDLRIEKAVEELECKCKYKGEDMEVIEIVEIMNTIVKMTNMVFKGDMEVEIIGSTPSRSLFQDSNE
ncbi:hypothetical protein HAX54_046320, partial [Datura stramonium]|nr:hypothetical protein [Datura stramonium]